MLRKVIKYTDYNDEVQERAFFFNLKKSELLDLNLKYDGGLEGMLKKIVDEKDVRNIVEIVKTIILRSYGVKSADGQKFMKSDEISKEFEDSEAFSELYIDLVSDPEKLVTFVRGVIPSDIAAQVDEEQAKKIIAPAE